MSPDEEKIRRAFKNPKFTWRTIGGIAKETGLNRGAISRYVNTHGDELIRSSARSSSGEPLYALRDVYRSKGSPVRRLLAAVKNRGD